MACGGHSAEVRTLAERPPIALLARLISDLSQWVSLKIKQARISEGPPEQDPEIQALLALEKHYTNGNRRLSRCFTQLLATFQISGPNGTHNCLVTEVIGPSVARVLRACSLFGETLRPDTVLRAARRVLQAVDFAHRAGVVHGGTYWLFMLLNANIYTIHPQISHLET